MQIHASAAGAVLPGGTGLPGGPAGLPPGLLGGPGMSANPAAAAAAAAAAGLPTSIPALLAGIPSSLAQAGPHPAFASLLAQQKPSLDVPRPKDEELKRAIADTNGSKYHFPSLTGPTPLHDTLTFYSLLSINRWIFSPGNSIEMAGQLLTKKIHLQDPPRTPFCPPAWRPPWPTKRDR